MKAPRVAIGSLLTECNQFGGSPIDMEWFERYELRWGNDVLAIDAGAADVTFEDGLLEVHTTPDQLQEVQKVLEEEGADQISSELSMVPRSTVILEADEAERTLKLLDSLEDLDDIQKAYTNADFPTDVLEKYKANS